MSLSNVRSGIVTRYRFVQLLPVVLSLVCGGCTEPQLQNTQASAMELARAIAGAVTARDIDRLHSLSLNEDEFKQIVWPSLPASRPERNLPFDYVWGDLNQKSEASLREIVAEHRGREYHVEDVKFSGPARDFGGYRVHSDATFVVRREGGTTDLRLCGSFIEQDGRWKAFSYAIER